ncbi:hypothetical protein [Gordonia terrae]|uniref:hypothetical protein n=1 Tax=Gordonia terrae TaxID=2055 RepID=UPI003F6D111A
MRTRGVAFRLLISVLAVLAVWSTSATASASPPPPHPRLDHSITVQVPGVVWGVGGAAVAHPRVFYGRGQIYPYPIGYGFRWHWRNLTTGAAGSIPYDYPHRRTTIRTGAGQLLVTGEYYPQPNVYISTPVAATFYVDP